MKNEQRYICQCEHNPHPSASKWNVFWAYLIRKEKYFFRFDSSAVCGKCGAHIRTPNLYRNPLLLLIYGVAVFGITIGTFSLFLGQPGKLMLLFALFAIAWLLFDRVFVAAIFTLAKWPTDEEMGTCDEKKAIWGTHSRWMVGWFSSQCAIFLIRILM